MGREERGGTKKKEAYCLLWRNNTFIRQNRKVGFSQKGPTSLQIANQITLVAENLISSHIQCGYFGWDGLTKIHEKSWVKKENDRFYIQKK